MRPLSPPHLPPMPVETKQTRVDGSTPLPEMPLLTLAIDGACNPNPGPMGIGYTISAPDGRPLVRVGAQIGPGTNNEAEYQALLAGMRHALRLGFFRLRVNSDSLLLVNQVRGAWKVRDARLKRLHGEATVLRKLFDQFELNHVYRDANAAADALSRQLVFEEPPLPPAEQKGRGVGLLGWQAATIRVLWQRHHPGAGVLARVYGVHPNRVENIVYRGHYKDADFAGFDEWRGLCGLGTKTGKTTLRADPSPLEHQEAPVVLLECPACLGEGVISHGGPPGWESNSACQACSGTGSV